MARKASVLRRYFGWAVRSERISTDPSAALSAPRGNATLPRILSAGELEALVEGGARTTGDDPAVELRDRAVVELCGLRRTDLAGADGTITVWGKGSRQRRVPISEPAADALERWLRDGRSAMVTDETPDDRVFLNRRGRPLSPRDVRRLLDRRSPVPTHPHALRHTFATHLLDGG
ncbi:MAG: tyrosine-type recombinase/integrase, partial [Actinobacteria bacterium]|nr:tyrosine-type recombinase/integrase [Actinomycetota bacterium]NIS32967.1 tyrosine-type recombinase/integrase [Actinomycetota bacterium]NIT96567.1 tyrosine-type recombinase/integrase [Actinomycetota bacterium]NIU20261.1 tyrosine-type recombinase/integrase [Actinomycetota bacterium]NIU67909.1 tyrosine-type recombinase/integrase [Actinomycetota bacterium]